jgi:hypothetical protein
MALFYADIQNVANGPAFGQPLVNRMPTNRLNGRVRYFEAQYIAPAAGTAPAIGDKIIWGKLPVGARIIGHLSKMYWDAGTAACTLNLGDSMAAARHLAATAVTALGNAVPEVSALVNAAVANVTIGTNVIFVTSGFGAFGIGNKVVGTGIPAGTTVTGIDKVGRSVTLSANATATNAAVAITSSGDSYVVSEDSNTFANSFGSTTDDATLISTVAGAQVANNQALCLKVAYVTD